MRFKIGDLAKVAVSSNGNFGKIVSVLEVDPGPYINRKTGIMDRRDYRCECDGAERVHFFDWQLQPINPPREPKSLTRPEEIEDVH